MDAKSGMKRPEESSGGADSEIEVDLLLDAIYRKYHYDFRGYARPSLHRRLAQACTRFGCATITGLQERVIHDPAMFSSLLEYLTIQVSEMFRDPSYFLTLRNTILPVLKTYPSIKVWCSGCSTGEEAYSLAILFREEELLERTIIYATDINTESLRKAEAGVYNIDRMPGFTRNYQQTGARGSLSDYYTAAYGGVVLDKSLQRNMVFADHSLATDEVFSEVHLVSCRNVLIYFDRELQDRCLGLFHQALCHRGFLGLGAKEALRFTKWAEHFIAVSAPDRIFRKIA
jgi:chemotaxis protein methyltransferase CheR